MATNLHYKKSKKTERGGFEPPVPFPVQLLSREPDSTALAPLQRATIGSGPDREGPYGERGIRTPGDLHLNGFQDRLLRPLGHLSNQNSNYSEGGILCQVKGSGKS